MRVLTSHSRWPRDFLTRTAVVFGRDSQHALRITVRQASLVAVPRRTEARKGRAAAANKELVERQPLCTRAVVSHRQSPSHTYTQAVHAAAEQTVAVCNRVQKPPLVTCAHTHLHLILGDLMRALDCDGEARHGSLEVHVCSELAVFCIRRLRSRLKTRNGAILPVALAHCVRPRAAVSLTVTRCRT